MRAADHHAVQSGRVLRDVDEYGAQAPDGRVVGLQATLGAVQGLRLGDVAFNHHSGRENEASKARGHQHLQGPGASLLLRQSAKRAA